MRKTKPALVYWLGESLYLNITNKCSNNCYFCLRNFVDGIANFKLKLDREPEPKEVIKQLINYISRRHWKEIVFCGFGEPTANFNCLLKVAKWISKYHQLPIRVDTNGHGYLLNPERKVIEEMYEAGVTKVSVSLNAADKATYEKICRPKYKNAFEEALRFIGKAKEFFKVEVTAVKIPELDVKKFESLVESLGVQARIRRYIQPFY